MWTIQKLTFLSGETKPDPGKGYIIKEDDTKIAYVVLVSVTIT